MRRKIYRSVAMAILGTALFAPAASALTWGSGDFATINGRKQLPNVTADGSLQRAYGRLVTGCGAWQVRLRHEKGFGSDTTLTAVSSSGCVLTGTSAITTTSGWNIYTDFQYNVAGETARTSINPG
jgi:hypothetical protein